MTENSFRKMQHYREKMSPRIRKLEARWKNDLTLHPVMYSFGFGLKRGRDLKKVIIPYWKLRLSFKGEV